MQNDVNVFHLTLLVSLHYLVKLEVLIAHVLELVTEGNSRFIPPQLQPQNRQI